MNELRHKIECEAGVNYCVDDLEVDWYTDGEQSGFFMKISSVIRLLFLNSIEPNKQGRKISECKVPAVNL